ncbi:MAG: hypothetical protein EXQ96_09910 [Alphaproteobacteria bacterium]|nr:hypothetical protein [Alphaproteobacteria bacterium]
MLGEVLALMAGSESRLGYLDPSDYERTVKVLLSGDSQPVITRAPVDAWTHDIWQRAIAR